MVSWFRAQVGHLERRLAEAQQVEPEQLLEQLVSRAPPGAMGLMLQPCWSPGLKEPALLLDDLNGPDSRLQRRATPVCRGASGFDVWTPTWYV
jgi:hypothetical protein